MNKKKLLALVLAALMSVSTTVVAFADESTPAATQNAGISTLAEPSTAPTLEANDVKAAKLHDTRVESDSENAVADEDLYTDYEVTYSDETNVISITTTGLKMHQNQDTPESMGYWVGAALIAPDEAATVDITGTKSYKDVPVESINTERDSTITGFAMYWNAADKTEKSYILEWKDSDGTVIGKDTFTVDLSGVKTVPADATAVKDDSELIAALSKEGYVMLTDDITLSASQEIEANLTLDLAGQTLTINTDGRSTGDAGLTVQSGKVVTITDSIGGGKIVTTGSADKYVIRNDGTLTLDGGVSVTSTSSTSSAVANYGTMTVENANITGGRFAVAAGSASTTVVNGGEFNNSTDKGVVYGGAGATIALNGGSFSNTNSKTAVEMESGTLTVKEGASITVSDAAEAGDVFKFTNDAASTVKMDTNVVVSGGTNGSISSNDIANAIKENGGSASVVDPSEEEENDRERSGGDYFGNAKWTEVKAQIAAAEEGDTIEMSGTGLPWFPSSVARALKGKDVTLEIRKNGVTYTLNGQKIGPITKIWYNFDENLETTLQPVEE